MTPRRARLVQGLASRLAAQTVPVPASNEIELEVSPTDLPAAARVVLAGQGRFLAAYGSDERAAPDGGLRVRHAFAIDGEDLLVVLRATLDPGKPGFASLATVTAAAAWPEREIHDLLGFLPEGHPDLRPLLPLVQAEGAAARVPVVVEGEGVHGLSLGPLHAGIAEAASHQFNLCGERVVYHEPSLFLKHRGAERSAEGLDPVRATALVERVCGGCAVANASAFVQALERLAACEPPPRAGWIRTAVCELERIGSHAQAIASLLTAAGAGTAAALAERAGEALAGAAETAFGSRLLLGVIRPGGVGRDLAAAQAKLLVRTVRDAAARLRRVTDAVLEDQALVSCLEGKGVLAAAGAAEWGVRGPVARASGSRHDARRDHPTLAYDELQFWVPLYSTGDALARFRIYADEAQQSAALIEETLENLPPGAVAATLTALPPHSRALGIAEAPRGTAVHAVHTDARGRIGRWHLHGASLSNWPALAAIAPGSSIHDFPLVEASFALCVSCVDR